MVRYKENPGFAMWAHVSRVSPSEPGAAPSFAGYRESIKPQDLIELRPQVWKRSSREVCPILPTVRPPRIVGNWSPQVPDPGRPRPA